MEFLNIECILKCPIKSMYELRTIVLYFKLIFYKNDIHNLYIN